MTRHDAMMSMKSRVVALPASHHDVLLGAVHGVLTTVMPNGQPQSSIVWVDFDGVFLLVNTALERSKGRNMQANPRVSLLVIDPQNSNRWIEVRGLVVEITRAGAEAHADLLAQRYCGKSRFYGGVLSMEQRERETRVIAKIEPIKVSLDAIFK